MSLLWPVMLACTASKPDSLAAAPAPEVFPDPSWVVDGRLRIDPAALPAAATPFAADRLGWRDGFSPVQTAVVRLPGLDAAAVGGMAEISASGAIRILDLDEPDPAIAPIPCFAELDAWEDAAGPQADPALLIRPQRAMTAGHRVAVIVGAAACPGCDAAWPEESLRAELEERGVTDAAFAWSFPVGDGTAPLRAMQPEIPVEWSIARIDETPPEGWLYRAEGTIRADNWLEDDVRLVQDSAGVPQLQGQADVEIHIYVPERLRDAPPGSAPILFFGHGLLAWPDRYVEEEPDSGLWATADALGAVVVATTWRGLTFSDNLHAVEAAGDFARIYEITDMLAQGVANHRSVLRAITEGDLLQDPAFGGLADPSRIYWYGISLGSIEGAVFLAGQSPIERAVLHVGGSAWSTMLERSSNWTPFEAIVSRSVTDPYDRQRLYAASQLFWDAVDPASYVDDLRGRSLLWQESINDEQVPNISTELLARSLGLSVMSPAVTAPLDIPGADAPWSAPLLVQLDPELPAPPAGNRPAPVTEAHKIPRTWDGTQQQTAHFLATGEVLSFCGEAPCTASNPGSP